MVAGLFLSWIRPSQEQQKICIKNSFSLNFDPSFHTASSSSANSSNNNQEKEKLEETLKSNGFFINRSRVLLGNGPTTFRLAKSALINWRHFALGWTFVDPTTPVEKGAKFCVCVKELIPWIMMPLQIAYVNNNTPACLKPLKRHGDKALFEFGCSTLQGHLLAGEERFSVELDENDDVWYEIFSFSKPAHFLSAIGYPYVRVRQKFFAQQSSHALLNHVKVEKPT